MSYSTDRIMLKQRARNRQNFLGIALTMSIIAILAENYVTIQFIKLLDKSMLQDMEFVKTMAKQVIIIQLVSIFFEMAAVVMSAQYFGVTMVTLRTNFLSRVFKLDLYSYSKTSSSVYFSHMTNDLDNIDVQYLENKYRLFREFLSLAMIIVILAYFNLMMFLAAIGIMLVFTLASQLLSRFLKKPQQERSELLSSYTAYVREILSAFRLIKANNLEDRSETEFNNESNRVQKKTYQIEWLESLFGALTGLLTLGAVFVVIMVAVYFASQGKVTAGYIILIFNSLGSVVGDLGRAIERIPQIKGMRVVLKKIEQSLTVTASAVDTGEPFKGFGEAIVLQDVSFSYEETPVLENVNMTFEKSGKYLLLGPSGGGKSTILRLLRKYVEPVEGSITIDGKPLSGIDFDSYLPHLANVEQHVFLFDGTLRQNIALYRDYSDAEILTALERAGLADFVAEQPLGLDMMIEENGKNLSGGEKARVAIARALVSDVDIILLDEAFAALDSEVARRIEKELLAIPDLTVILVSHVFFADTLSAYDAVYNVSGSVTPMPVGAA